MKNFLLNDIEIQALLQEPKYMDISIRDFSRRMRIRSRGKPAFLENSHKFTRASADGDWRIYARRSRKNALDFSCGLEFIPKGRRKGIRLIRCNGKSHRHENKLEKQPAFYDFHIHRATEKYQRSSFKDDHYAETTDSYADFFTALKVLVRECNLRGSSENKNQMELFE